MKFRQYSMLRSSQIMLWMRNLSCYFILFVESITKFDKPELPPFTFAQKFCFALLCMK